MGESNPLEDAIAVRVLRGDMRDALRVFEADRFHAVVTDPPYGLSEPLSGDDAAAVLAQWILEGQYHRTKGRKKPAAPGFDATIGPRLTGGGFMGAGWDAFVPSPTQWAEVYRVLRPGGYALVFAGTRTAGWMAVSLMLAGFEVLDQIDWLYGEGFPKGGDVSKRIDKAAGAEREVVGQREVAADRCPAVGRQAVEAGASTYMLPVTAPATDEAAQWEDWSTTLKPAHEPIIVARKPLREKSVGANLLAWRAGALNIGACRVESGQDYHDLQVTQGGDHFSDRRLGRVEDRLGSDAKTRGTTFQPAAGRWPANVVLSHSPECDAACAPGCAAASLDEQGGDRPSGSRAAGTFEQRQDGDGHLYGACAPVTAAEIQGSSGGPTRFFYCAKASRADREAGLEDLPADDPLRKKGHPTVKPTALMRWLVRLVCPPAWRDQPAGEVLDPFGGSGSTGVALALEGFRGVLCERDDHYAAIAERRVARALAARESGDVPRAWREKKPKPIERKGCADGCPVDALDEQSGHLSSPGNTPASIRTTGTGYEESATWGGYKGGPSTLPYDEGGGASRFFATFTADPAVLAVDLPDEQIARLEVGAPPPLPEEVAEVRRMRAAPKPPAEAYHQRDIARRLHARAYQLAKAGRDVASNTLRSFACELEAELAPEVMADRAAEG